MKAIDSVNNDANSISLQDRISEAIAEAHQISEHYGPASHEAAVAWDIVEELDAEAAHQRTAHAGHTAFMEYCENFPEADEARMYDV
jgi:ribosomal 50S subunit-associated protein YjgA (DUF615 family)